MENPTHSQPLLSKSKAKIRTSNSLAKFMNSIEEYLFEDLKSQKVDLKTNNHCCRQLNNKGQKERKQTKHVINLSQYSEGRLKTQCKKHHSSNEMTKVEKLQTLQTIKNKFQSFLEMKNYSNVITPKQNQTNQIEENNNDKKSHRQQQLQKQMQFMRRINKSEKENQGQQKREQLKRKKIHQKIPNHRRIKQKHEIFEQSINEQILQEMEKNKKVVYQQIKQQQKKYNETIKHQRSSKNKFSLNFDLNGINDFAPKNKRESFKQLQAKTKEQSNENRGKIGQIVFKKQQINNNVAFKYLGKMTQKYTNNEFIDKEAMNLEFDSRKNGRPKHIKEEIHRQILSQQSQKEQFFEEIKKKYLFHHRKTHNKLEGNESENKKRFYTQKNEKIK